MSVATKCLVARSAAHDDPVGHDRFGRRSVEVDAHTLERGHRCEPSRLRSELLSCVGLVDPDVDRDLLVTGGRPECTRPGEHLCPQPVGNGIVGIHVDVDHGARAFPERPPVGDVYAGVVANQPGIVVGIEARFAELVDDIGERDVR